MKGILAKPSVVHLPVWTEKLPADKSVHTFF